MADHSVTKIDHANHLLLDQPLVRLPYELLHKNFRSAHFAVAKEDTFVKKQLRDTANAALNGGATPDDVLRNLDTIIARMRGVKRKLEACSQEEARLYQQLGARSRHLGDLTGMHAFEDVKYEHWSRKRLDRLMVDYLMRQGYSKSARALAADKGIGDLVDIETFEQMNRIRQSLLNRSSNLEFQLRFQQYIELVRTQDEDKLIEAITFAHKFLYPFKETFKETFKEDYGRAGILLAIPPGATDDEHQAMYDPSRWARLADLFTEKHNALLGLPSFPLLHIALQSGLSALKTPACHSSHASSSSTPSHHTSLTSSVCPICSTELNELARNVPYAHHTQSHVEPDLLLLPNGRVYGQQKLEGYARKAGLPAGKVKDLRTGEVYSAEKLKKVYIT
ncbi:Protein FYV10 [Cytospora mali]|uniref:Protein FYV10 n=1 Tax=Cytospora mali TaxID=578113 RepID=A0A194V804_CYTMA|nr:Protein FYV10 [Valsa mali var. pyri (nom. inval.)]